MLLSNIEVKSNIEQAVRRNHCIASAEVVENGKTLALMVLDWYERDAVGNKSPGFYVAVRPAGYCERYRPVIRYSFLGNIYNPAAIGFAMYAVLCAEDQSIRDDNF